MTANKQMLIVQTDKRYTNTCSVRPIRAWRLVTTWAYCICPYVIKVNLNTVFTPITVLPLIKLNKEIAKIDDSPEKKMSECRNAMIG